MRYETWKSRWWVLLVLGTLVSGLAYTGLPPTTVKSLLGSVITTFQFQAPFNQWTKTGGISSLLETGNNNIIANPSFEHSTAGSSWTASGGATTTVTSTSANVGSGTYAYDWDSNSASQTLTSSAVTLPAGLYGRNGEASCNFKCASGTCTHTIGFWDGTTLSNAQTITSNSTYARTTVNFVIPSSGTGAIRITSVASDEPELYIDDCYLGEARNIGSVAQATFIGSAYIANTASCDWSRASASLGAFGTTAACPGPTVVSNPGPGTIQTTDTDLPQFTVNNLPPGTYAVYISGDGADSGGAASQSTLAINDGTSTSGYYHSATDASNSVVGFQLVGEFTYSTPSNVTFRVYGATSSGTTKLYNRLGVDRGLTFKIFRFPSSPEQAFRPNQTPASWAGYHDNTCAWSRTNTSYGAYTDDASCALVERANRNFGTVSTNGSVSPAITFTPPRVGRYLVSAISQAYNSTSTGAMRLWDGTTVIGETSLSSTSRLGLPIIGVYNAASTSAVTLTLQCKNSSGTCNIDATGATSAIEWSLVELDAAMPAPILVGSVTSNSTGQERTERVTFGGSSVDTFGSAGGLCTSSPCTIWRQSGSWITSITRGSTGNYTANIASGIFSAPPTCNFSVNNGVTATGVFPLIQGVTATSLTLRARNAADSADIDIQGWVDCKGPR